MKNYLLLFLIGLCTSPSIQCAESAGARDERLHDERLKRSAALHQSFLDDVAALDAKPTADPSITDLLDTVELLLKEPFISQNIEIRIKTSITFLEDHAESFAKRQKKRAKKIIEQLQEKLAAIEDFKKKPILDRALKLTKDEPEKKSILLKANLHEMCRLHIMTLSQVCNPKNPLREKFLKQVHLCPNHGYQKDPCNLAVTLRMDKDYFSFPTFNHKQMKHNRLTKSIVTTWKNDPTCNNKERREMVFNLLMLSKGFDNLESDDHKELIDQLGIMYNHTWICQCTPETTVPFPSFT